jgi:hypothetical protein
MRKSPKAAPKSQVARVLHTKPYHTSRGVYIGMCQACGKAYVQCKCKVYESALRHGRTNHANPNQTGKADA